MKWPPFLKSWKNSDTGCFRSSTKWIHPVSEDCGSYAATINLKYGASNVPEDRKRWMGALKAVANCTGHTSQEIK
ncbi:unnamed protein product [Linum tenue]|uniref:PH domain-containing protein n=1 Tax=Linum tenue TaxID=586396 RepID=A0AAV0P0H0_9ROSI|nr:unnamed protein product [Linum tenue]